MAFQRPSRGSEPSITRRDAARTQRRCRCARTSLAVTTRAKRYAYALRPHATSRGRAQGSRHTSGAKTFAQHAPPIGGDLWIGSDEGRRRLRCSPGATTTQVATLNRSGWRTGPRRSDGDARNSTRTNSRAAPATLSLHLDVSILRQAQDCYVAKNAFASATEATDNVAWPLLKNRVLTSSMNTPPPLAGS